MKTWLSKAWNDTVGSKVIATGILASLAAIAAWLWPLSNFSTSGARAWAAIEHGTTAFIIWLGTPVTMPCYVLGVIVCALVACLTYIVMQKVRSRSSKRPLSLRTQPSPEPLTVAEVTVLQCLFNVYPRGIALGNLSGPLKLNYGATEKLCDDLKDRGLVDIALTPGAGPQIYLTKTGRDYCIERNL